MTEGNREENEEVCLTGSRPWRFKVLRDLAKIFAPAIISCYLTTGPSSFSAFYLYSWTRASMEMFIGYILDLQFDQMDF
jgi:hypothetical protein